MRDSVRSAAGAQGGAASRRDSSFIQTQLTTSILSVRARARELLAACRDPTALDALDAAAHRMSLSAAELRIAARAAALASKP